MATKMTDLAKRIGDDGPVATFRISTITALEGVSPFRVKCDATDTAWLACDGQTSYTVGDKVYILQQGSEFFVAGKIGGAQATPIGSLTAFAGSTAPNGWLLCDGSAVSRTTYAALFAICGTTYGAGNGTTTFNLPNLADKMPVGSGARARGATGGASTVALSTAEMPSHNHGSAGDHAHVLNDIAGAFVTTGGGTIALSSSPGSFFFTSTNGAHTHSSNGSGTAHENMPPFVAMPYIIRAL